MEENLRQILESRKVKLFKNTGRELSAVLVPLYRKQGEYYLLFTKRTEQVKTHKGQIAFPGGVFEEWDGSLLNTALRECAEEIGLEAERVEVLGKLDEMPTQTSNYVISPFVGVIPWPYNFKVNDIEIEEIIEVPVLALLNNGYVREGEEVIGGEEFVNYSYNYGGKVIWGATARILKQFLDIFALAMK